MKYLKKFNENIEENSIVDWCITHGIRHYTINENDVIDVDGNVDIRAFRLKIIPIQFGIVNGFFLCLHNKLISLKGCPREVGGYFNCSDNFLTSLEGASKKIGGYFDCHKNKLISLEGLPEKIGGVFNCEDNPIYEVYRLFGSYERYKASLDYNYWRGTDIVRGRFKKALNEINRNPPNFLYGYKYIYL
jgi:hypothetical protein